MHKLFSITGIAILAGWLLSCGLSAMADQSDSSGKLPPLTVSVKDFGAKGDGVSDDTDAIQRAVNAAAGHTKTYPRMWGAGYPELVFPSGNYLISRTVVLASGLEPLKGLDKGKGTNNGFSKGLGFAYVRGQGEVTIRQSNPKADIFYVGMAYKTMIENITFDGGRHGINLWTGNQDASMPIIRHCRFRNSSGYAIQTPYITRNQAGDFFGYCIIAPDGTMNEVNDPDAKHFLYHSTYLHIDDCEFINCANVLFTVADMALMENCRIETSPAMKGAAIRTGGLLKLENITALAHVRPGLEQRWIDLDFGATNWIVGRNLKFTTDSDIGLCAVYSLDRFRRSGSYNPSAIILQDSEFKVAGCPENSLIFCKDVPNIISVSNCTQTGNADTQVLGFPSPKPESYFIGENGKTPIVPNGLAYMIDDRNRHFKCELPPSMRPFQRAPLPVKISEQLDQMTSLSKNELLTIKSFSLPVRTLNAADFGIVGDGVTDDSAAIQKVFNAAKEGEMTEILFPGAVYKIGQTIRLPARASIRGSARAVFLSADQSPHGFSAPDVQELAILNCAFESGGRQMALSIGGENPARILFDNCSFSNSCAEAITCISGAKTFAGRTASRLRIANTLFYNNRTSLVNNVTAVVDSCWLAGYAFSFKEGVDLKSKRSWEGADYRKGLLDNDPVRETADVKNYGIMRAENILGVPMGKGYGRNFRWFDNTGTLLCDYFRFGGEQGGRRAVDIIPGAEKTENKVVIRNSWLHHMTGSHHFPNNPEAMVPQSHMVFCATAPDLLVLQNNIGMETSYPPHGVIGDSIQSKNQTIFAAAGARIFMSTNIIPETTGIRLTPEQIKAASGK
ncbi:MAG: glycosyl hydrolase family 28-related protein [Victivallales bacterium]